MKKNIETKLFFVDFSKIFDSILGGKIEQMFLAYGLPKENVTAIMMNFRNTKAKVRWKHGLLRILQEDAFKQYLFINCQDYVLRTSIDLIKENSFSLKRDKKQKYPAEAITDTDDADDRALLANTPT